MMLTLQLKAGPLDAYQANHAAIQAGVDFEQRYGTVDRDLVVKRRLWDVEELGFKEDTSKGVDGRWECDGTSEHLIWRLAPEAAKQVKPPTRAGEIVPQFQPFEHLDDGEVSAFHYLEAGSMLNVGIKADSGMVRVGPFNFFGERFVQYLHRLYPTAEPASKKGVRGGYACEIAIYRLESPTGLEHSFEIAYDPSIGFLPRFIRELGRLPGGSKAAPTDVNSASFLPNVAAGDAPPKGPDFSVNETYLVEARACRAGGFVPMEWRQVSFRVDNLESTYPKYDDETVLVPSTPLVGLVRYKASRLDELSGPARLDKLDGVRFLSTTGGTVPIPTGTVSLTMNQLKSLAGAKLSRRAAVVLPNIDEAELHEFDHAQGGYLWLYLGAPLVVASVALGMFVMRRRKVVALLAVVLVLPGCHSAMPRVVKLNGAFLETRFVYDASRPTVSTTLVLRNEGTVPLRVFNATGGCACRRVDRAGLPADLKPGRNLRLGVSMSNQGGIPGHSIAFTVETDQGPLQVPVSIDAMPDHQLSPGTATLNNLLEDEEGTFELTHRHVYREAKPASTRLEATPNLSIARVEEREGRVAEFPGYQYRDTTYRVKLEDRALGLRNGLVSLLTPDRKHVLDVPVIWKRVEYLTTVPERVSLARRPLRVFLRCPDLDVELRKVETVPRGVKAVISSPRELTVQLAEGAPERIDDVITVSTTAEGRPPLKVKVVRYTSGGDARVVAAKNPS